MKIGNHEAKPIEEILKGTTTNFDDIKYGGRIILPQAALEKCTSRANMPFPLIFKLKLNKLEVCCGVHSFEAKPNEVFIPAWIKDALKIDDFKGRPKIEVWASTKEIPKGTNALFQPQSMDFLDFSNPKAVLERSLRFFTCLGKDDIVTIHHNHKVLKVKICKTEPQDLILIVDCDLSVEFIAPPGYVEPVRQKPTVAPAPATPENKGQRCDGKPLSAQQKSAPVPQKVVKKGAPDFDYKIGSIKLDRHQVTKKKTKEAVTSAIVTKAAGSKAIPKGTKLVERPAGRRPVTRSQTKTVRNVSNQASTSRGGQDQDPPEPMDQE